MKNSLEHLGVVVEVVPASERKVKSEFIKIGRRLNTADLTHIQYEYSFFSDSHYHFIFFIVAAWHFSVLLRQVKIFKVITFHELEIPLGKGIRSYILRKMQAKLYKKADQIVVHTDSLRQRLLAVGINKDKIAVIPFPIPEVHVNLAKADIAFYKNKLGLADKKILTIFGFIVSRKGYEVALAAVKELDNCVLLIAGGPHPKDKSVYYEKLIRIISESSLTKKVRILGYLSAHEVCQVMSSTDIVLAPFKSASGSSSLSFAAAFQKPIIASDIDAMKELKEAGLGVELFKSGDSEDLKQKIGFLVNDFDKRHRMSQMNKHYSDLYSYSSFARAMHQLYRKHTQ